MPECPICTQHRESARYHTRQWKVWRALQWRTSSRQKSNSRHRRGCRDGAL